MRSFPKLVNLRIPSVLADIYGRKPLLAAFLIELIIPINQIIQQAWLSMNKHMIWILLLLHWNVQMYYIKVSLLIHLELRRNSISWYCCSRQARYFRFSSHWNAHCSCNFIIFSANLRAKDNWFRHSIGNCRELYNNSLFSLVSQINSKYFKL